MYLMESLKVAPSRGDQRRRLIFRSLHDCILLKGYVKTTLADIAQQAGMSASHLLYYFKGKEAILEQYFANVSVIFLDNIISITSNPADRQLAMLADFWFKSEASTKQEIGFMLECFGAAVNDPTLLETKAKFDQRFKTQLAGIIAATAGMDGDQGDDEIGQLAEITYALMIGLRSSAYFSDELDLDAAHRLFCTTVNGFVAPLKTRILD